MADRAVKYGVAHARIPVRAFYWREKVAIEKHASNLQVGPAAAERMWNQTPKGGGSSAMIMDGERSSGG